MSDSRTAGYLAPLSAPVVDDQALEILFQAMVVGITGLDPTLVRPRYQVEPPPQPDQNVNWCGVGIYDQSSSGAPYLTMLPGNPTDPANQDAGGQPLGTMAMQRHKKIEVLATFYGPARFSYAELLVDGLAIDQNRSPLLAYGIALQQVGEPRNVPDLVGFNWVLRTDLMLTFWRQVDRVYPVRALLSSPFTLVRG